MTSRALGIGALLLAFCLRLHAADPTRAFGLEFTVISNAVIRTNEFTFIVEQAPLPVSDDGTNEISNAEYGVSMHLGEAQSGVYVYPAAASQIDSGGPFDVSMWGYAYGTVDGNTNRLVSSIRGTRLGWGEYGVQVDFSALGATSYTYQVWCHGIRVMHTTNRGPDSGVATIAVEDHSPRVNPFVRTELGIAAVIEFPNRTLFAVASGPWAVGDRFLIVPEGVTNQIDHLARVDIFGSANLDAFAIDGASLGMFGLPHRALGGANFSAAGGRLRVGPFADGDDDAPFDGVRVDFKNGALQWTAETEPFALEQSNGAFRLAAYGLATLAAEWPQDVYMGPAGFIKSNGTVYAYGDFYGFSSNAMLRVFNGNVLAGSVQGPIRTRLGSLSATNPVITGWKVDVSSVSISLAEPATLAAHDGQMLEGDRFEFAPEPGSVRLAYIRHANVLPHGVESFTLVAESAMPVPVPEIRVHIERSAEGVTISGPWHPCYMLATRDSFASNSYWQLYGPFRYYDNLRGYHTFNPTNRMQFYQLIDHHNHRHYQ